MKITKTQLIEMVKKEALRLNKINLVESRIEEINKELGMLNEETYIDPWDNKKYSSDEINNWINIYRNRVRMPAKDKETFKNFFKRIGLNPKDYEKIKPKSILKLKRDGYGYRTEGVIDGYKVVVEFTPDDLKNYWCCTWYINDKKITDDCFLGLRSQADTLDQDALTNIEEYKEKYEK
jgi:hypothetical protein